LCVFQLIVAGAFYPNYFTIKSVDLQQVERELSNKDYKYNVIVSGCVLKLFGQADGAKLFSNPVEGLQM
jgi:hypothetical protein